MTVIMRTIPNSQQRYPTVGDWFYAPNGDLHILVSELPEKIMEYAVMLHEFAEAVLCEHRGICEESVSAFDIDFESKRQADNTSEPGDDPKAPYFKEHQFATSIEMQFAGQLKLNWGDYEKAVNDL